ncbi:hypothetical protein DFQ26_002870 [Actinomortierella ambigua]|nr:hypothetical protein DFQ26_002870 [Actinomortierella ambigua]
MRFSFAVFLLASVGVAFSQKPTNSTKPSIVLVHGALADGSSWSDVITQLQARKYENVWAVQQPLSSIPNDIAKVNEALDWIPGPVVLVGHSFGGMVVTNAGNHPKVKALVYVSAFTPNEGETVASMSQGFPPVPSAQVYQQDKQGRFYLKPSDFHKYFCPDLPRAKSNLLAAVQGLTDLSRFEWKSGPAAWKTKPSYVVVSGKDQIIPPQLLAAGAKKINPKKVLTLPRASHATPFTASTKITKLIVEAAEAVAQEN